MTPLLAAIYTGRPGRSPFDPTLWSSISRRLFTALERRGLLHRAVGVELPWGAKALHLAATFSASRERWKAQLMYSVRYRAALTRWLRRQVTPEDAGRPFFQIGAMFDMPSIADGRVPCVSYHDGCLAERVNSPLPTPPVAARVIDRALEYERRVHAATTRIFTFSHFLRASFIQNYGVPPDRVAVIGAGINLDRLPEPDPDKRYDTQEVLFIGIDFPRKGGDVLLRAFARVRERYPAAVLHVVGPKSRPAAGAGVEFHGFLGKDDPAQLRLLDALFRRSSLFVLPSLYEPFGIAPLEAMAYGLPCVVSNRWALAEMVVPGLTGELVEPGSDESLAEAVVRLLASPDDLRCMGQAGRVQVEREYSWDRTASRLSGELTGLGIAARS
jgi:alpha-maltose-1-phosphate synthase